MPVVVITALSVDAVILTLVILSVNYVYFRLRSFLKEAGVDVVTTDDSRYGISVCYSILLYDYVASKSMLFVSFWPYQRSLSPPSASTPSFSRSSS